MKRSRLLALVSALVLATAGLIAGAAPAQAANLLTNPGFETGTLSGWSCSGGTGSVVTSPVRSGSRALAGAASSSDQALCTQTVSVLPNTAYSLTAWVRGNYVYLGVTGGASTWTPGAASYTQLTVNFTGASQTTAQVFLHGWYGQGTYNADDVSLDGPGGSDPPPGGAPGAPANPSVTGTTANSISLSWTASAGTVTGYRVYEGSQVVKTVTGTSTSIDGLSACTSHSYAVAAHNSNGESVKSTTVSGTTTGCANTGLPKHALIGYLHASFANGSGYIRMADVPS